MVDTIKTQKCTMCRKHQNIDEFKGLRERKVKTCKMCRARASKRCEHGKHKHACKTCGTYKYISVKKNKVKDLIENIEKNNS